jgi:hypothetical protein
MKFGLFFQMPEAEGQTLPRAEAERAMRRFAEQVMPQLGAA